MLPANYTLDEAALIVWRAAKQGRENARDGRRATAVAYMEGLARVGDRKAGPPALLRIARDAASAISELLQMPERTF